MPESNPLTIVIADDHQIMVDGLCQILRDEASIGDIHTANDGRAAVALVDQYGVDCVIMDINMPGMNGIESTRMIKDQHPHTKVIMVSMLCDASIIKKALKAGADAFVVKNTGKMELLKAIAKVMKGEKYVSEELSSALLQNISRRPSKDPEAPELTPREKEIIRAIAEGLTNQEIGGKLFLSPQTVATHRKNILSKLQLKNTAALIKYAAESRLL